MRTFRLPLITIISLCFACCDQPPSGESESLTPQEKTIQAAAKPFLDAIAAGDYAKAHAQLSSHAKARMSPSQFIQPADEAAHAANQRQAAVNVSPRDFQLFVTKTANEYGTPSKVISADQIETDSAILQGKGDALETAFSIGLIPDTVPAQIRRGAVRAQIGVKLAPAQLKEIADRDGMTVEELEKSEDFEPYCNLKVVLVDEVGTLKVGYFEFTPPSMWD